MMESDSGQDCTTYRRVRFVFDMNMLFSAAFAHEVDSVTLYASDASGKVVYKKSEAVASIVSRGYMDVNDLQPGTYTFRVWATGEDRYSNSYTYGDDTIDREDTTRLSVVVNREHAEVSHDLTPLFFGVTRNADMTDYQSAATTSTPTTSASTSPTTTAVSTAATTSSMTSCSPTAPGR